MRNQLSSGTRIGHEARPADTSDTASTHCAGAVTIRARVGQETGSRIFRAAHSICFGEQAFDSTIGSDWSGSARRTAKVDISPSMVAPEASFRLDEPASRSAPPHRSWTPHKGAQQSESFERLEPGPGLRERPACNAAPIRVASEREPSLRASLRETDFVQGWNGYLSTPCLRRRAVWKLSE